MSKFKILKYLRRFSFWLSFFAVVAVIFDLGFSHDKFIQVEIRTFYFIALLLGIPSIAIRYFISNEIFDKKVKVFDTVIFSLFSLLALAQVNFIRENIIFFEFFNKMGWIYLVLIVYFVRELSRFELKINRKDINPAQLFILSFLILIILGTLCLMLPKATHDGISFLDALFTSTSAVCVTGLIVVDTGSYFTLFGQTILLILIQLGGLGIMTFASYFSYFFRGSTSYENQLMMKNVTDSETIGEVFSALKKILFITFIFEFIGAVFIYFSLDPKLFDTIGDRIFFSIFHTISGFCNAGFSTLEYSLYQPEYRLNFPLHIILAVLFILGGLGFPIVLNIYKFGKYFVKKNFLRLQRPDQPVNMPWVLNLNSRIVLVTTAVLLVGGMVFFMFFEYNNTLKDYNFFGKLAASFFGSSTPRTAGFNSVDMGALNFSTIMVIMFLMWVGASPGSTGGGIKTSTIAIATLNFLSLAKGKDRVEVYNREIANNSLRRAFAIMSLSMLFVGFAILLISYFDPEMHLLDVAFECISAYSTVGLSLGITGSFSSASKIVLVATMFAGRVSMLTIMAAFLSDVKHLNYKYPTEEVLIN
ncbi:TrkH family potassium uptake protein [Zunongwangia sp. HGR-M22]|uniref:TrkH family potassium uptake protein n=1 Tax=Zunongwangia sp. HGR-M22 TaxID=3015168 RepID=UPI0022DCFD53|nr:potassium transporter TrkG [Zunongwangia sp. HGR-M22]WBL26445.1 ATPase [Zunongwangia sp. HGR-M22]